MSSSDDLHPHVEAISGALFSQLLRKSNGALALKGQDGRYAACNQSFAALFSASEEEICGKLDHELTSGESAKTLMRGDRLVVEQMISVTDEIDLAGDGDACATHLLIKFPVNDELAERLAVGLLILDVASPHQGFLDSYQGGDGTVEAELQRTLEELERSATTDPLTGVWNRRRLAEAIESERIRLNRFGHPVALLLIDIDHFKAINDNFGHSQGDLVLIELVARISAALRGGDSLARWGGEEFIVLCPNTGRAGAALLAERIRSAVATTPFQPIGPVTVSIGVGEAMVDEEWQGWFDRTDQALYSAKHGGRNRVELAEGEEFDTPEQVSSQFLQLAWRRSYDSGEALIDQQHRNLFHHTNQLLAALLSGRTPEQVATMADDLLNDIRRHFSDEEGIFSATGFPMAASHAALHRHLLGQAEQLLARFHTGETSLGELFQFLAHDVVARHILGADRQFFPYIGGSDGGADGAGPYSSGNRQLQ
jgi:diguanylate cyclase (GGDEF)-like protein/hemerythrin-like metal-binding protein